MLNRVLNRSVTSSDSKTSARRLGVAEACRRLGVVLRELERVRQKERIEPRRGAGRAVTGIDVNEAPLSVGQADRGEELGHLECRGRHSLAERRHRLRDGLDSRLFVGRQEEWAKERAMHPFAERQARRPKPFGQPFTVGRSELDVRTEERRPDIRGGHGVFFLLGAPVNPAAAPIPSISSQRGQLVAGSSLSARSITSRAMASTTCSK